MGTGELFIVFYAHIQCRSGSSEETTLLRLSCGIDVNGFFSPKCFTMDYSMFEGDSACSLAANGIFMPN
jgi:hypothetical protein